MARTVVVIAILGTGTAWGYVRATTQSGTPLRWTGTSCIPVVIDAAGSDDVTDGSDVTAARDALSAWREGTKHCSYIRFDVTERAGATAEFSQTGPNETTIAWKEAGWPYDPSAASVTTLFYVEKLGDPTDGHIVDGDIELNGVNFTFGTTGSGPKTDVQNVLAREVGRLLGLDANCYQGFGERPKDHTGADVPDCTAVLSSSDPDDVKVREATMFPFSDPGETSKRTPEADDIAGICAVYPVAADPGCHPGVVDGGPPRTDAKVGPRADGKASVDGRPGVSQRGGCSCQIGVEAPPPWALVGLIVVLIGGGLTGGRRRRS